MMGKLMQGLLLFLVVGMIGCAGGSSQTAQKASMPGVSRIDNATVEVVSKEQPLVGIGQYKNITVGNFEIPAEYQQDYPEAIRQFRVALISDLNGKNLFDKVTDGAEGKASKNTVQVSGKVLSMRIASTSARFWGGAMAGSSYIEVYLKLTDASTGKTVHEKVIATSNNAFGASWNMGSSDQSIPTDMAKIISEYLSAVLAVR